ncbi:MAG: cysteine--tRNA ligase [Epsilonproteobacteria bacterium]|nr:cysteine--tRNA ligase [Campylobacterota bacterium]
MYIYDSVKKEKVKFIPIKDKEVNIYVCGPTVYDDAHLGHARSALTFDLLTRTLRALGYKVTLAKNFTDIDDKIINKMKETKKSLKEITTYYINRYLEDMEALNVKRADIEPKATQSIDAIEEMVLSLLNRGCAYKTKSGDIYFDTSKDKRYGTIFKKVSLDESIARVTHKEEKKDPRDFALWKAFKADDIIYFDSKLGKGRPGWHIECSAMIKKHFQGDKEYNIDIHGGGADLIFPHHENEAAQTRCSINKEIAKYWMHNGFVKIDGEKMSKSLGNSFFIKDALKVYDGELIRYYLIGVHYRSDFNFNEIDLLQAKKRLDKLYRLKKRLYLIEPKEADEEFKKELLEAMSDDLNVSKAFAIIDSMINRANEILDQNSKSVKKGVILGNIKFIEELLGIGTKDPFKWFQQGVSKKEKKEIEELIEKRALAKKEKNFALADEIRDRLKEKGIILMDTPNGTKWEKI